MGGADDSHAEVYVECGWESEVSEAWVWALSCTEWASLIELDGERGRGRGRELEIERVGEREASKSQLSLATYIIPCEVDLAN